MDYTTHSLTPEVRKAELTYFANP